MPENKKDYAEELIRLADALSEPVIEMSREEILEELREDSQDPAAVATQTKGLLFAALKNYTQQRLRAARQDYDIRTSSKRTDHTGGLPHSAHDRRQLLELVLSQKPTLGHSLLTLQHRQLDQITDTDVESLLSELEELGALDDLNK